MTGIFRQREKTGAFFRRLYGRIRAAPDRVQGSQGWTEPDDDDQVPLPATSTAVELDALLCVSPPRALAASASLAGSDGCGFVRPDGSNSLTLNTGTVAGFPNISAFGLCLAELQCHAI
jgi:hypothetical protein